MAVVAPPVLPSFPPQSSYMSAFRGPSMGLPTESLPHLGLQPAPQGPAMPPQRPPAKIPPGAPAIPNMNFPPQRQMDSAREDGPHSVAYRSRIEVIKTGQALPCPDSKQYVHRGLSVFQKTGLAQPIRDCDIRGWVLAAMNAYDFLTANSIDAEVMHLAHNPFRLVFQCISGWSLMIWKSQEAYEEGINGARRAPRPLAWWDLRKAWDVQLEVGDPESDVVPHRIVVMMNTGNLYFLVDHPEDVPAWFYSIRGLIMDHAMQEIRTRDTPAHQQKRWPLACGLAAAMLNGQGVGERALAITFHAYDLNYDCTLQIFELMLLIREISAGMLAAEGRAEGQDREAALYSASTGTPDEELFERGARFRKCCDVKGDGKVRKDDFIRCGLGALMEAVDMPGFVGGLRDGESEDFSGF